MARHGTNGRTFLVLRPDSGQYIYNRVLRPDIAPYVSGTLDLPWAPEARCLEGKTAIKISLQTGDLTIAQRRWAQLHPQIERLVLQAAEKVRSKNRQAAAGAPRLLNGLSGENIAQLAGQARHDILAEDDRRWTDPHFRSPLAQVVAGLIEAAKQTGGKVSGDARQAAQDVAARHLKRINKSGKLADFDCSMSEGKIDAGAEILDRLASFKKGDKLPDDLREILFQEPNEFFQIPNDIENTLLENGISLAKGHPDRQRLALALLRAEIDGYDVVKTRRDGATTPTPPRPDKVGVPETEPAGATISQVRERWIELIEPGSKAIDDNKLYVGRFIDLFGDIPIADVTRKMARDFRDALKGCPRNPSKEMAKKTLQEQIAWAKENNRRLLSQRTINAKGLGSLSRLMTIAMEDELISANPCAGLELRLPRMKVVRLPYSIKNLTAIFDSPVYVKKKRWKAGAGEAQFWIPLIALFSGGRLEEIGQLIVDDIVADWDIIYFNFTDIPDDDDEDGGEDSDGKKVKTPNARRTVPVHPILVACGFLKYVEEMRKSGATRLFPELDAYKGVLTHNWSKWWGRYADKFVTKNPLKVFHSLRHVFTGRLRNLHVDDKSIKALVGHARSDVTDGYGNGLGLKELNEIITKLDYPGLDLTHLYKEAA